MLCQRVVRRAQIVVATFSGLESKGRPRCRDVQKRADAFGVIGRTHAIGHLLGFHLKLRLHAQMIHFVKEFFGVGVSTRWPFRQSFRKLLRLSLEFTVSDNPIVE